MSSILSSRSEGNPTRDPQTFRPPSFGEPEQIKTAPYGSEVWSYEHPWADLGEYPTLEVKESGEHCSLTFRNGSLERKEWH